MRLISPAELAFTGHGTGNLTSCTRQAGIRGETNLCTPSLLVAHLGVSQASCATAFPTANLAYRPGLLCSPARTTSAGTALEVMLGISLGLLGIVSRTDRQGVLSEPSRFFMILASIVGRWLLFRSTHRIRRDARPRISGMVASRPPPHSMSASGLPMDSSPLFLGTGAMRIEQSGTCASTPPPMGDGILWGPAIKFIIVCRVILRPSWLKRQKRRRRKFAWGAVRWPCQCGDGFGSVGLSRRRWEVTPSCSAYNASS